MENLKNVGKVSFALIGGFSGDAVAQILQRVSEMLVTMISGSDNEKAQYESQRRVMRANSKTIRDIQRLDTLSDITVMKQELRKIKEDLLK